MRISLTIRDDLAERLDAAACDRGVSRSAVVRAAIEEHVVGAADPRRDLAADPRRALLEENRRAVARIRELTTERDGER